MVVNLQQLEIRRRIRVRGLVQGVGFRPFVHRTASRLGLGGWVRNDGEGVAIEAQGRDFDVAALVESLRTQAPPLARIDAIELEELAPAPAHRGFEVLASGRGAARAAIGPDVAVCDACLAELFDPKDRRYRYEFINCTDCGPRFTLTRGLPYDRAMTSMARFALCPECANEYGDPAHRRFHAEPNACPVCGPHLWVEDASGRIAAERDPVQVAVEALQAGRIVALKDLGGFHLACDARNPRAIAALRARKHRDEQPLAIMAANAASLEALAELTTEARALLDDRARPIVLLPRRPDRRDALPGVADGIDSLGAMLPYTPLQHLLFHEAAGRPNGTDWLERAQPLLLVMTSANPHGEPLVIDNGEARERLAGIADLWLLHDRDIVVRCDDSVVRCVRENAGPHADARRAATRRFVRRARGFTPAAIRLARAAPPVLGLGGYFKVTACLTRADEAFLSPHVGELDNAATRRHLEEAVEHLRRLLEVRPEAVAHDMHPDFFSSSLARRLAADWDVPAVPVQHHHAHIAAVLAEHRIEAPVLGLALDGVGFGSDGEAWGGELLAVDGATCTRLAHLRKLALPGGDRAAREPWRMGASALALMGRGEEIVTRFAAQPAARTVAEMLARGLNCPRTSSLGRWFDAAAGLLGVKPVMSFEGQAAMLLEGLARRAPRRFTACAALREAAEARIDRAGTLDLLPLLARLAEPCDAAEAAGKFHASLVEALARWVEWGAGRTGLGIVAFGGGCFLNEILSDGLRERLARRGLRVLEAQDAPPNDGGLALGQCWVAQRALPQATLSTQLGSN
jgi:hydrogenase maturation protein HypF